MVRSYAGHRDGLSSEQEEMSKKKSLRERKKKEKCNFLSFVYEVSFKSLDIYTHTHPNSITPSTHCFKIYFSASNPLSAFIISVLNED